MRRLLVVSLAVTSACTPDPLPIEGRELRPVCFDADLALLVVQQDRLSAERLAAINAALGGC